MILEGLRCRRVEDDAERLGKEMVVVLRRRVKVLPRNAFDGPDSAMLAAPALERLSPTWAWQNLLPSGGIWIGPDCYLARRYTH